MKGLRKYLTPFAPDQSGAVSVLFELGGLVVVCDAGGCTGNICGFDEPRWHTMRSAVFSAGLRDMDAILGRDDKLVAELADAAQKLDVRFAAIVGTPVPAVIGTDFSALRRLCEKKTGLPVFSIDTSGTRLYDAGAEKAYTALVDRLAREKLSAEPGRVGVFGINPLDTSDLDAPDRIRALIPGAVCYGAQGTLEDLRRASSAEKNIVASPSGLKAARLLRQRFGTPFAFYDPLAPARVPALDYEGKSVMITAQQATANTMRREILARGAARVVCATWFTLCREYAEPGDTHLSEEDDFADLAENGGFDILIADSALWRAAPGFGGIRADLPQFSVSGRMVS